MEPTSDITLAVDDHWISPYAFSCYVALVAKGIPHRITEVALHRDEQHTDEFRARSVTGRVPALTHGDFHLAESSAIAEYLDEVFPAPEHTPLFPDGARDRARARQVMAWIRSDLMALREERPTSTMFYARATTPLSTAGALAADKLVRVAARLIPAGARALFARWTLADADLAFMLHRLILNGHDVPADVRAFAEAQWAHPAVRSFVDRPRPAYRAY